MEQPTISSHEPDHRAGRSSARWVVWLGVIVLAMVPRASAGHAREAAAALAQEPYEYKLAVIQLGSAVDDDAPLVAEFAQVLNGLEAKCSESRERLANMGVRADEILRAEGINEPLIDVFESWRLEIPEAAAAGEVARCAPVLSAYITSKVGPGL